MNALIDFASYPIVNVLPKLLRDKTSGENILLATDAYVGIPAKTPICIEHVSLFQPRTSKSQESQNFRTKQRAEVFTPAWLCNRMNNICDNEWFEQSGLFNIETENGWQVNPTPISFKKPNDWRKYVESLRLEITCGEAPYIISRYDSCTGEIIPLEARIGVLDRKIRIISENVKTEENWLAWVVRAFQSVYGYEFQGDNLLIARANLLSTFTEYLQHYWSRKATQKELETLTEIIVWNFWQMDGFSMTIPYSKPKPEALQLNLFALDSIDEHQSPSDCLIFDWKSNKSIFFKDLKVQEL